MASFLLAANGISSFSLKQKFPPQFQPLKQSSSSSSSSRSLKISMINHDNTKSFISMSSQSYLKNGGDGGSFTIPKGLSEETIRLISFIKKEPNWMLEFRLNSYNKFLKMVEPKWSDNIYPNIDLQCFSYYSKPAAHSQLLDYVDEFGRPMSERIRQANVATDTVVDSVSIGTTHRDTLEKKAGVIFCSISDAIKEYPDLVKKYLGKVVPNDDNYYAALNSAVFSDGSFVYIPKGTRCPMPISTSFRIKSGETGQFERTLIIADEGSFVEYLEGCTAPESPKNQLHAAVVELHADNEAEIKYSTVQNWAHGDEDGKGGGVYNFVTKRGLCSGVKSKISWTQVETGSAITWKYPSVVMEGDESVGEFYSVALTKDYQQADTGSKMIHKGNNTKSRIISKGVSAGNSRNVYRGGVQVMSRADNARNFSQCDSMLIGDKAAANTYPYIQVKNDKARIEHEASTSKIGEDQLFYFQQRGIDCERAMVAMISGFGKDVFNMLPNEFGAEVNALLSLKLKGSVG